MRYNKKEREALVQGTEELLLKHGFFSQSINQFFKSKTFRRESSSNGLTVMLHPEDSHDNVYTLFMRWDKIEAKFTGDFSVKDNYHSTSSVNNVLANVDSLLADRASFFEEIEVDEVRAFDFEAIKKKIMANTVSAWNEDLSDTTEAAILGDMPPIDGETDSLTYNGWLEDLDLMISKMKRIIDISAEALDLCANIEGTTFMSKENMEEYDELLSKYKKTNNDEKRQD